MSTELICNEASSSSSSWKGGLAVPRLAVGRLECERREQRGFLQEKPAEPKKSRDRRPIISRTSSNTKKTIVLNMLADIAMFLTS